MHILIDIHIFTYLFNRSWIDTRWQQCFTLYTQTVHIIQRKENWEVRAVPRLTYIGKGKTITCNRNVHVHRETTANNQLNDRMTAKSNILFDVILRHTQPLDVIRNTTYSFHRGLRHTNRCSKYSDIRHQPHTHHITQHKTTDTNNTVHLLPRQYYSTSTGRSSGHTQWERIFYLLTVFFLWSFLTVILNFDNIFTYRTVQILPMIQRSAQCFA
jgi:hypothetical protein